MTDKSEQDIVREFNETIHLGLGALWLLEGLMQFQKEQQERVKHLAAQTEWLKWWMTGVNDVIEKAKELCGK